MMMVPILAKRMVILIMYKLNMMGAQLAASEGRGRLTEWKTLNRCFVKRECECGLSRIHWTQLKYWNVQHLSWKPDRWLSFFNEIGEFAVCAGWNVCIFYIHMKISCRNRSWGKWDIAQCHELCNDWQLMNFSRLYRIKYDKLMTSSGTKTDFMGCIWAWMMLDWWKNMQIAGYKAISFFYAFSMIEMYIEICLALLNP